jgi:iron-sulfur cluster repair protein YtfE (RIC family)
MNRTNTQAEVIERIMQEHDALRDKVRRIHAVLSQPEPAPDDIEKVLREFLNALVVHFSTEEEGEGFFAEVTAHAPRLAGQAGKLCVEHAQLLREFDEICRFAAAGSPSMPWWRELRSRCHAFNSRLMHHEHEENSLLQRAYQEDIGVND